MEMIDKLIAIAKTQTLLYVEDDMRLQAETVKIFSRIFNTVITANDGQEGLETYKQNADSIDIIATDIEMPFLNGLEMSKEIKAFESEVPVIVISAYTDAEYFLDAISYDVDYYLVKPINTKKLLQVLYTACSHIEDKHNAMLFEEQQIKMQIENEKQLLLEYMSNSSPNPILVFKEGDLQFMNIAFSKVFLENEDKSAIDTEEKLIDYLGKQLCQEEMFITSNEIAKTIDITTFHNHQVRICCHTTKGNKFYSVMTTLLEKDNDNTVLYTFNDITELLLQKIQLELYDKQIDSMVTDNFIKKTTVENGIINKVSFSD